MLEQSIIKKVQVENIQLELDNGNSKEFKVKTILEEAVDKKVSEAA